MSIVFAVGAVLLCYDLGRVGGRTAGVAAVVVARDLLLLYGSFERMYALFAFAAGGRSVRARPRAAAQAAALAAAPALSCLRRTRTGSFRSPWKPSSLLRWRGRLPAAGAPHARVALGVVPFLVADLRLLDRFGGARATRSRSAQCRRHFAREVLGGLGGGTGVLVLVIGLALAGLFLLRRRSLPFVAYAAGLFASSALLLVLARAGTRRRSRRATSSSCCRRAALVGVAAARVGVVGVAALAAVVFLAPGNAVKDRACSGRGARQPRRAGGLVREQVGQRDVLFPYSPVYLSALPETGQAVVSRARPELLLRELDEADYPVLRVFIAVPQDDSWRMLVTSGPFVDRVAVLRAIKATSPGSKRIRS